jgi:hypothetical protein
VNVTSPFVKNNTVYHHNTAPFFTSDLGDVYVTVGVMKVQRLPNVEDVEGDQYIMSYNFAGDLAFVDIDG